MAGAILSAAQLSGSTGRPDPAHGPYLTDRALLSGRKAEARAGTGHDRRVRLTRTGVRVRFSGMATRRHYNADTPGQYDIWLLDGAGQWLVQERVGGPGSNSRFHPFISERLAETFARSLMNDSAATVWRELPVSQARPANRAAR